MHNHARIRAGVGWIGIERHQARALAVILRNSGGIDSNKSAISRNILGQPHFRLPRHDPALGVESSAKRQILRWALGIPAVLILPHPLHADGAFHTSESRNASAAASSLPFPP